MKPSTELFRLIRSMSRSEKRFFKLTSSLQKGEKNYLKLFDAIDDQSEYDEEAIKEKFKGETFIRHLPSEKNHLYKHILKSLRLFHSDDSIGALLQQGVKDTEILFRKRLFKESRKHLKKAKKLAELYEKFYYLLEIINWEKTLLQESIKAEEFSFAIDDLVIEEKMIMEKIRNLADYEILYSKMHFAFKSGGFVRCKEEQKVVEDISSDPLIQNDDQAMSTRATTLCHYIRGYCHLAKLERDEMYREFKMVKDELDEEENLKEDLPHRYIDTVRHLINFHIARRDFNEARELINELEKEAKGKGFQTVNLQVRIFEILMNAKLLCYDKKGEHDRIHEIIPEIEKGLRDYGDKIGKEQKLVLYFNIAYLFFGAGDRSKAISWLSPIINDKEDNIRRDVHSYARLFNLIIHYELGNYDLLEYIIRSTYRYLGKTQRDLEVETLILKYLKKIAKTRDQEKLHELFKELKEECDKMFLNEKEQVILEYFDVRAWLNSKLEGISFSEAKTRKLERETEGS